MSHAFPHQPPPGSPLTPENFSQLAAATAAAKRIRRAVSLARVSAWTTGIFALLTLMGILLGDLPSLVLGGALLTLAIREGRFAARLAAFDLAAPRLLAINQLILGAVIITYAAWQGWGAFQSNGLSIGAQPVGDPKVDAMLEDFGSLTRTITLGFYASVALGGGLATSLMALYYSRRTPQLRTFLAQQAPWIIQAMRAAA